jgi:transcriptional regulator with XRE-family HTH domain
VLIGNRAVKKTSQSGIEQRIAAHLKQRRLAMGLSLADLAGRSGVSRAMISKVERSAASPTAALLGRLCNGLGVTLSALIANAEQSESPFMRVKDQTAWQDPVTGLVRTMISPSLKDSVVEIVRVDLPAEASVNYDPQRYLNYEQHVVPMKGRLHLTVGDKEHELGPWDCLLMQTNLPLRFHNNGPGGCRYLVIVRKT